MAAILYVAFVAIVSWSFADRDLWSDEVVSLMLIGGHDPAAIVPGTMSPDEVARFYDPMPQGSLADIWRWTAERDNHPPGYITLFAAIMKVTGDIGHHGVRFVNIALSGLFIFPLLLLMREMAWRPSLSTAALATISPFAMYAAREIRAYGFMMALTALSAWFAARAARAEERRWAWLAGLLAVNVAGCSMHKLFVLVVAAQLGYLGLSALVARSPRRVLEVGLLGLATLALLLPIPNLFTVNPTITAYETEWLQGPLTARWIGNAVLVYLAYYAAWWIAPPDDLMNTIYGYAFVVAFLALLLWLLFLLVRGLIRERWPGPALLFVVPPLLLVGMYIATGNDFSRAARYSIIWTPVSAAWLIAQLRPGRELRHFTRYAAVSLLVGCALVLTSLSHRNPDRTRDFAETIASAPARIVWPMDETLNTRALLLAVESELRHSGVLPGEFLLVDERRLASEVRPADTIVTPERYRQQFEPLCAGGTIVEVGKYFSCTVR